MLHEVSARGGGVLEWASRAPCDPLRRHVRSLVGYDERSPGPRSRREFPEPWIVMIIEFGPALRVLRTRLDTAHVDWAVARIESCDGGLDIGSLARELGCSHKHLISLFRDQVGIPPKLLARLVRFERVMHAARAEVAPGWAELALVHGYCDQAHLAREVKQLTGLTPTEALLASPWVNFVQETPSG